MRSTKHTTWTALALLTALGLTLTNSAHAATKTENLGVFGGAVAGAAAGGPVGLLVGAALGGHYAHQRQRAADASSRVAALHRDLGAVDAQAVRSTAEAARLAQRLLHLSDELAARQARVDALLDEQTLLTQLHMNVLFRTDDATLSDADKVQLLALSKILLANPALTVRLDGHADARGTHAHNDSLSMGRAQAVAALLEGVGVNPGQIESRAFGKRQAHAGTADAETLARQRRVKIELLRTDPVTSKVAEATVK